MTETPTTEITEKEYWAQLKTITDRIKPELDSETHKHIGDKLNNAWIEGMTTEEWVKTAGIWIYLD